MESTRKPGLRPLLAVVAAVAVAATVWCASALAFGGSSSSPGAPTGGGPAVFVQTEDPAIAPDGDCPHGAGSGGSGSSGSTGANATDL